MKRIPFLLVSAVFLCGWGSSARADIRPTELRCEYQVNPLGIDVIRPRLSWVLQSDQRCQKQTAYHVLVASSEVRLEAGEGDLWDSGQVKSGRSTHVVYNGKPLQSRWRCYWKVRVWDKDGVASAWSEPACWSMGLLKPSDWQAQWIAERTAATENKATSCPWFRRTFALDAQPKQATVYVASIGYHELYLNGQKVSNDVLSPAVSDYRHRVLYVTHDVTKHLRRGLNCMGLWLGPGWAGWPAYKLSHGPAIRAQLEVELADGRTIRIGTDDAWKAYPSPITILGQWRWGNFGGERYDATREVPGWSTAELDDSSWQPVVVIGSTTLRLSAQMVEPNRRVHTIQPLKIDGGPAGTCVIDMGRNYTGWLDIRLHGPRGRKVTLEYSERADQPRSFNQFDEVILRGDGPTVFSSRFNYHAFRLVTVTGLDRTPQPEDVKGYLIHTNYRPAGEFECSNELFNQIYRTTLWTYRCLSLGGYVVDCPHRERQGYGAEGQAAMETALCSFEQGPLYTKWLRDWRDVQDASTGKLPHTAPQYVGGGGPAWGAIIVTLPWEMYRRYGDKRILEDCYPTMQRYLHWLESKSKAHVLQPWGGEWDFLGDWVAPGRNLSHKGKRINWRMPARWRQFFNTCYWLHCTQLTAETAAVLGKPDDAAAYRRKAAAIREAVQRSFFDPQSNSYVNSEPPYLAFPLMLGVVPPSLRGSVMAKLEHEIAVTRTGHVYSGVLGTYVVLKHLTQAGHNDLIFTMVNHKTYPGWGYMLQRGATTIWERWDGEESRNHTSFLSVGAWFIEGIAGIRPDPEATGFKRFVIRPAVVGDLAWARASYRCIHGLIESQWQLDDGRFTLRVTVPVNTTASVYVPVDADGSVSEGGQPVGEAPGVQLLRTEGDVAVYRVGSGEYLFESTGTRLTHAGRSAVSGWPAR